MRIAVVKPDWGIAGGFERLLDRLLAHLVEVGHEVQGESFPAIITPRTVWGVGESKNVWHEHNEFFRYMALVEDVRRLDLHEYDLVLSTQPPTFLADHPRVMSLFYHQQRVFYDLAEPFIGLGEADADRHREAMQIVRDTDLAMIGGVRHWLAGSQECASRLEEFWNVDNANVSLLHAPPLADIPSDPPAWDRNGPVVCVSRHEWPKRTELMVGVAQLVGDRPVELIGGGGRTDALAALDARLTRSPASVRDLAPEDYWMRSALNVQPPPRGAPSTTRILGNVSDSVRNESYARASVVVAPAYREDYGLTALEAMWWKRPLIVCSDGGGLVDIVKDTGAGLIVEPTPQGIAEGVERIVNEPGLAEGLLEAAEAVPSAYTWDRAHRQLDDAIERARSAP